ncbi:MAG: hypothetical protein AB1489_27115, partial [Acidobacteriota bacterium]
SGGNKFIELNQYNLNDIIFSPDGRRIFASANELIIVMDVETSQEIVRWKGHKGDIAKLAISPDGRWLASGGEDHFVYLWEIATGKELAHWEAHQAAITTLAFSPDGKTLASGSRDGTVKLWNIPFIHQELSALGLGW